MKNNELRIDRIEGNIAVCEYGGGDKIEMQLSNLPDGVKESDIISVSEDGSMSIASSETAQRKKQLHSMQQNLFKKK